MSNAGTVVAPITDAERISGALTVLRDAHPRALEIVAGERRPDTGEVKCGLVHPWAYSVRKDGFYFEHESTWGGWYSKPRHLLTWTDLDAVLAGDPRVQQVRAWSHRLRAVDAWKDRSRPFELWPDPDGWHPSYIDGDHARRGWRTRIEVWRMVLSILTDAIERASRRCP